MTELAASALQGQEVDRSLGYLMGRLALVELEVREAVQRRLPSDPEPGDPLRGVYLSDSYVLWLLDRDLADREQPASGGPPRFAAQYDQLERDADAAESAGAALRLRQLSRAFGLDAFDEHLLVIAMAPALDPRFQQLFGYLNDDVQRVAPTVLLAVELASGVYPSPPQEWSRLAPSSPLVRHRLLELGDPGRPLPSKTLLVPDRIIRHLLGHDAVDAALQPIVRDIPPLPLVDPALAPLNPGPWLFIRQRPGTDAAAEAVAWLAKNRRDALVAVLPTAARGTEELPIILELLARECRLTGRPLVLGPADVIAGDEAAVGTFGQAFSDVPGLVLWATTDVDLGRGAWASVTVDLTVPKPTHRRQAWAALGDDLGVPLQELHRLADHHRVGAAMIRRAVTTARAAAATSGRPVDGAALGDGLRMQDGAELQRLSRRVRPRRSWEAIILPRRTETELRELVGMIRARDRLADDWGLARGGNSRGVAALFVGPSGAGKTLAAEVVAGELGVDLYTVNLATVVDKYIGETEKNLDRVLSAAEGVTGVVLFDEADALFGKRADVQRGQDRYANLEVSYLLQRVEDFSGVVILSTNLRSHVDDAFLRRLDSLIEFSLPDPEQRLHIWQAHSARLPQGEDLDFEFAARSFELSGGNIRNCVAMAAALAAESEEPVSMRHVVRALEREQQKLGRLRVASHFGPYAHLLGGPS